MCPSRESANLASRWLHGATWWQNTPSLAVPGEGATVMCAYLPLGHRAAEVTRLSPPVLWAVDHLCEFLSHPVKATGADSGGEPRAGLAPGTSVPACKMGIYDQADSVDLMPAAPQKGWSSGRS